MGFFSKPKPILKEEDINELKEIERTSYMEQARILVAEKAKARAKKELGANPNG